MQTAIKHTWHFKHAPEVVWDHLTKPDLLAQWLMENDIKPVVGHQFMFKTKPVPKLDFDGNVFCEVLDVAVNRRLSYSWKGGPGNGAITLDSVVIWRLTPKENGTELQLEHKGFRQPENFNIYNAMNEGWDKNIRKLIASLDTTTHERATA